MAKTKAEGMTKPHDYELTIDLHALNHLGINLYSNIPAVISETVANSWDADAEHVWINVNKGKRILTITDDGSGMNEDEINQRYLRVGYNKRDTEGVYTPRFHRHVMGRKGIGKLSLFSIAKTIEVHSVRTDKKGKVLDRNALRMNSDDIKAEIDRGNTRYKPVALDESLADMPRGTRIIISDLKSESPLQTAWIRKRLARRFSIIGEDFEFDVQLDDEPISVEDRDYFSNLQYIWTIGEDGQRFGDLAVNADKRDHLDGVIDQDSKYRVSGWIGTFDEQRNIEDKENNSIVVLAWGKLVQEDLLPDIDEAGLFTKYLIGEIRADFLDDDERVDISTSDRQRLQTDDPRYRTLRNYVQGIVKGTIKLRWAEWRKEGSKERALKNAVVREWYELLPPDSKKYAHDVFERIERAAVPNESLRRELYRQSILAFETFAHRQNLSELQRINDPAEFERFTAIFASMDQLEEAYYYTIVKGRLEVLSKFEDLMTPKTQEKTIQRHIFSHLWLLHPSWERASTDQRMEVMIGKEWKALDAKLKPEERKARLDIQYKTAAGKHIIVELKKYDRRVNILELVEQVRKYQNAVLKVLKKAYGDQPQFVETVIILGSVPLPQDDAERNAKVLAQYNARWITYDTLIRETRESYADYIEVNKKIGAIRDLISRL